MRKIFLLLGVFAILCGAFGSLSVARADVPEGALTGTAITVNVGQIKTMETVTVTNSGSPGEIRKATDIYIKIPAGAHAIWDTAATTPIFGDSGAEDVTSVVSYPNAKTLLIDVTKNFSGEEALTIDGLSYIGYAGESDPFPLEWSVDGGLTYGNWDDTTDITVAEGAESVLTSVSSVLTSAVVSSVNNFTVNFTVPAEGVIPADGKIVITFPAGFNVSGATAGAVSGIDGAVALSVAGQAVTFTRQNNGTNVLAGVKSVTINNIVNHAVAGSAYALNVATYSFEGLALANAASAAFSVNPKAITDLSCKATHEAGVVYLLWTVPDGVNNGYGVRYSPNDITDNDLFAAATNYSNMFESGAPGALSGWKKIAGLAANTVYFFNVKARGTGTSCSAISNTGVSCTVGGGVSSSIIASSSRPSSVITSPPDKSSYAAGETVVITGLSSDNGVSSVRKVEVSTDGGATWKSATSVKSNDKYGFNWRYKWTLPDEESRVIKSRATNRLGVTEIPGEGIEVIIEQKEDILAPEIPVAPSVPATPSAPVTVSPPPAVLDGAVLSAPSLPYTAPVTIVETQANLIILQSYLISLLERLLTPSCLSLLFR